MFMQVSLTVDSQRMFTHVRRCWNLDHAPSLLAVCCAVGLMKGSTANGSAWRMTRTKHQTAVRDLQAGQGGADHLMTGSKHLRLLGWLSWAIGIVPALIQILSGRRNHSTWTCDTMTPSSAVHPSTGCSCWAFHYECLPLTCRPCACALLVGAPSRNTLTSRPAPSPPMSSSPPPAPREDPSVAADGGGSARWKTIRKTASAFSSRYTSART